VLPFTAREHLPKNALEGEQRVIAVDKLPENTSRSSGLAQDLD